MKGLYLIVGYLKRHRWNLFLGILCVIAQNYFRTLLPMLYGTAIDLIQHNLSHGINGTLKSELYVISGKILLYTIILGVFMYAMRMTIVYTSRVIEAELRYDIFQKLIGLDISFFKKQKLGDLISRMTEDLTKVRELLGPGILYFINLVSIVTLAIYRMMEIDLTLTLWSLLPLPFLSILIYFVRQQINSRSLSVQKQIGYLISIVQEVFSGIMLIKSYDRIHFFSKYFGKESHKYQSKVMDQVKVDAYFYPLMMLISSFSILVVIVVGAERYKNNAISIGELAQFILYLNMLTWPFTAIGWIVNILEQAIVAQRRISFILNHKVENQVIDPIPYSFEKNFSLKNVDFRFEQETLLLKNINISVNKGQKIIILGKTGSGKSTLLELMIGLYKLEKGKITLDDVPINKISESILRTKISYVEQRPFLFSDSIQKNIDFIHGRSDYQDIINIAKISEVHGDILDMTDKYQTIIGEKGIMLSGGQKQRIALARSLMTAPDILLLDNNLSAVDSQVEYEIVQNLDSNFPNCTLIYAGNIFLKSIKFDQVYILENGEIVAHGTPDEMQYIINRDFNKLDDTFNTNK